VNPLNLVFKGIFGSNLNASISALEQFGTTRTLSSPRIHAINNQKAVLSFADRLVYFKVEQTQSSTAATGVAGTTVIAQAITSTKLEEKQGVELEIIPSINVKTKEITLNIKPKITIKTKDVVDPANALNLIPVMQSRELNTTAKIQSGNALVIGGLMKESTSNSDTGVPFLANIPVLGWLFKFQSKSSEIIETVIFVKATVVSSGSNASKHDRELQNKLDSTPKPFFQ
jgi:general secretion pathway protein D